MNQWINELMNQWTNELMHEWINEWRLKYFCQESHGAQTFKFWFAQKHYPFDIMQQKLSFIIQK